MKCRLCDRPAEAGEVTCGICQVIYAAWRRQKAEQRESARVERKRRQREHTAPLWKAVL